MRFAININEYIVDIIGRQSIKFLDNNFDIGYIWVPSHISSASKQNHVDSHKRLSNLQTPNFYCDRGDCRKAFMYIDQLKDHTRLHDNNLILCNYCPWKGTRNADLIGHMNHHFKLRRFKCSFCDILFYTAALRNRHETDLHEKIADRYKCDKCLFKTHSNVILYQHKAKIHR